MFARRGYTEPVEVVRIMPPGTCQLTDIDIHDHACWVQPSSSEGDDRLRSYLIAGLDRGQQVAFLGWPPDRTWTVAAQLSQAGVPVADRVASGQLILTPSRDEYLVDGAFDPQRRMREYADQVRAAQAGGFGGLRVAAEVGWLPEYPSVLREWPSYELQADLLASELPFAAVCMYDPQQWDQRELALAVSMHSLTVHEPPRESRTGFRVHAQRDGSVRLYGELDAGYADAVHRVLSSAAGARRVPVLDVADLRFVDVAGMRTIALACRDMVRAHGRAIIRGASPQFQRIWQLAQFDQVDPAIEVQ